MDRARHRLLPVVALTLTLVLGGCSSNPFRQPPPADSLPTPAQVLERGEPVPQTTLRWGGVIVDGRNLAERTELTILAFPLDGAGRPDTDQPSVGRFIAVDPGYLELTDLSPGRRITVGGPLQGWREGTVGEARYRYPVLGVETLDLWRERSGVRPQFHIGIGIGIH